MSTLVGASGLWILKPARGSQGEGIKLLNRSSVLGLRAHYAQCVHRGGVGCAAPQVLQPYLRQPLLREGVKWDMRTYVLCTSVLPMRLYLFSEARRSKSRRSKSRRSGSAVQVAPWQAAP